MNGFNSSQQLANSEMMTPDPQNGNYIICDRMFQTVPIRTKAAETRKLAVPDRAGLRLTITMVEDGGDCVITCDGAINAAGNTIMTLADIRDSMQLESIPITETTFGWDVVKNSGNVALS